MNAPDQRNDGLAPGHPGRGKPTSLIRCESPSGDPEVGGFYVFFPSGATKTIGWRQPQPISPTLDAAKEFTAKIIESLQRDGSEAAISDFDTTNWTSVVAAVLVPCVAAPSGVRTWGQTGQPWPIGLCRV